MDPFTEKLLERTRARRENLQRKMAERPNAANMVKMVKRAREPLGESNSVSADSASDGVPQLSFTPSTPKRKCSEEHLQPAAGEENQEPPRILDPPTDKKPPVGPSKAPEPEVENMMLSQSFRPAQLHSPGSAQPKDRDTAEEDETLPLAAGMKSRLQRLAEQRKCWDGGPDAALEVPPPEPSEGRGVPPAAVPASSSGTPLGRKGRLAHLAATIGSWEDDLSHAHISTSVSQSAASSHQSSIRGSSDTRTPENTGSASSSLTPPPSVRALSQSPQRRNQPPCTLGPRAIGGPSEPQPKTSGPSEPQPKTSGPSEPQPKTSGPSGPQPKTSAISGPSGPQPKTSAISSPSGPQPKTSGPSGPQPKTSGPSGPQPKTSGSSGPQPKTSAIGGPSGPQPKTSGSSGPQPKTSAISSPLGPQPKTSSSSGPQPKTSSSSGPQPKTSSSSGPQPKISAISGPSGPQPKALAGRPAVKSFLERFEERCQERTNQGSPLRAAPHPKTPAGTPNPKLVQDPPARTPTSTAELTQRQKLERESELALIRQRPHKDSNMWKNKQEEPHKPVEKADVSQSSSTAGAATPTKAPPTEASAAGGQGLVMSPPASTSSPLMAAPPLDERELSAEQSVNSALINQLFEGVLDQSEEEEQEEEDALNISSMSLLTPLAETVAAVVKSPPVRDVMTSTPDNSFTAGNSPQTSSSRFHRTTVARGSSVGVASSDDALRLPYSVDAYRSTRVKETDRPNVKQVIVRKEQPSIKAEEPIRATPFNLRHKMKIVSNKVTLQQTVIHQASQALNCCTDQEHGKGSQVEAEAERLLLLATETREALIKELERMKAAPAEPRNPPAAVGAPPGVFASRGSVTLQELRLPLKADFVCSIANRPESSKHSFFILIRAGAENTVATALASTHHGLSGDTLSFNTRFTIADVSSDFGIDLDVYCLVQKRDVLNDKKKKSSKSKAITPKRFLAITKSSQTPVVASPGGPNAVRTSNFVLVGSHRLTLSSVGKTKFPLEKVPFLCPLEGHLFLRLQCDVGSKVEGRGFLTMFEDVSGFGAWHRRWCVLSGYYISYWTYPDDDKTKNPIGRINLVNCTSGSVGPANREFCARPNTFELVTSRAQREEDKDTLVTHCNHSTCVTTNWLSADTKEERNDWMRKLNQIVTDLRLWQPDICSRPQ